MGRMALNRRNNRSENIFIKAVYWFTGWIQASYKVQSWRNRTGKFLKNRWSPAGYKQKNFGIDRERKDAKADHKEQLKPEKKGARVKFLGSEKWVVSKENVTVKKIRNWKVQK